MRRPYQILMPLFSLFLVRVDLTDLYPVMMEVDILKVYDGDTVLIRRGSFESKVRLSKIDAPEKAQNFVNSRKSAGEFSKRCLQKLVGKNGSLRIEGIDIYGRILGDVGEINFKMVKEGCASLYPHAKFESRSQKYTFLRAFYQARRDRRGLWAHGGFRQPKAFRSENKKRFRKRIARR